MDWTCLDDILGAVKQERKVLVCTNNVRRCGTSGGRQLRAQLANLLATELVSGFPSLLSCCWL